MELERVLWSGEVRAEGWERIYKCVQVEGTASLQALWQGGEWHTGGAGGG